MIKLQIRSFKEMDNILNYPLTMKDRFAYSFRMKLVNSFVYPQAITNPLKSPTVNDYI